MTKKSSLSFIYGLGFVVLLWYGLHYGLDTAAIPSPHATFYTMVTTFPEKIAPHLLVSLGRIAVSLALASIIGTIIGVLMGLYPQVDRIVAPIVYVSYPLPKIAFLPILMILFGLGELPKIILIVSVIIFQFIVSAKDAVKDIPQEWNYSMQSLGLSRWQQYQHLLIPAILPQWFTALRNSVGVSIAVLFFCENFATRYGIGYAIMNSWAMANYTAMFSGILALSLGGLGLYLLIDATERYACPWISISKASSNKK